MSDTLPTIWDADPHTRAKHAILRRYLVAWFPILTRQASAIARQFGNVPNREILFIDGFAGPGEYVQGDEGSPIIALKTALNHDAAFPLPVRLFFIEARQDRFTHLQSVLASYQDKVRDSKNIRAVDPRHGDCDSVLNALLDEWERKGVSFGPALAFLDQFGYGDVSMQLIARILKFGQCEVFSYLDYKNMNRWITDPSKALAFTRAYGGEEWRGAIDLPERERRRFLLDQYMVALKDPARANAKYVVSFAMFDRNGQPLYWLLFCTNSLRGLEEMKKAMWAVDGTGEFRFSDKDNPDQLPLFDQAYGQDWLAEELAAKLAGQTLSMSKIKEYVLTSTPCYLFKGALRTLENDDRVKVVKEPTDRRPGTYPDDQLEVIELTFQISLF